MGGTTWWVTVPSPARPMTADPGSPEAAELRAPLARRAPRAHAADL
ncbi:hypothetical protein [Streptomyces sp. NBC_01455]|nr:hypothetical protein [Streptomyces sp. NBC_01455]